MKAEKRSERKVKEWERKRERERVFIKKRKSFKFFNCFRKKPIITIKKINNVKFYSCSIIKEVQISFKVIRVFNTPCMFR